jgi:hypothetical protein
MDRTNKRIFNKSAERDEDKKLRRILERKDKRNDEEKKKLHCHRISADVVDA